MNRGRPRVFLDMPEVGRASFGAGACYRLTVDEKVKRVVLELDHEGDRVVSSKVEGSQRRPLIDLSSHRVLGVFSGLERVRILFMQGCIIIVPLASELAQQERLERLRSKLKDGRPLAIASLCHGAGLMAFAAHEGMREAGLKAETTVVNEIDERYAAQSRRVNPVWGDMTVGMIAPLQEVMQDDILLAGLGKAEVLEVGIPCSGASRAGGTKRKLEVMEEHPEVGHLIVAAMVAVKQLQPAIVIVENVPDYSRSGSAHIARHMLRDMGYQTEEMVLNASDFGCLEARKRWFLVATTKGVGLVGSCVPEVTVEKGRVADHLEEIGPDDSRWSQYDYLKAKQVRDAEEGKGFKMQFVTEQSTQVPTLRKLYWKVGSCDPLLRHPGKEGMLRKFTAGEHASLKGFPAKLIEGVPETMGHEILGQGVAFAPVKALFKRIGHVLKEVVSSEAGASQWAWRGYDLKGTG